MSLEPAKVLELTCSARPRHSKTSRMNWRMSYPFGKRSARPGLFDSIQPNQIETTPTRKPVTPRLSHIDTRRLRPVLRSRRPS